MRTMYLLAIASLLGAAGCRPAADDAPGASVEAPRTMADEAAADAPASNGSPAHTAPPPTDAKADVVAAGGRFLAARSYHATIATTNAQRDFTMDVDFVAPDRYRMAMPMGTQTIIGDTMHMQLQGRTMTAPVPPGTTEQWRDPNQLQANTAGLRAEALGPDTVDGTRARKYRITHDDPALRPSLLWIGEDGYPLRVEADGEFQGVPSKTVITYSRFDDPAIRVDPP